MFRNVFYALILYWADRVGRLTTCEAVVSTVLILQC